MVQIPEQTALTPEQAFERLQVWFGMQQQLGDLKTAEVLARKGLADYYFPTPEEGTNRIDLGGGFDLKLDHKINRVVDEAALMGLDKAALKFITDHKIPMGELFVQKWELKTGAYRTLDDAQRKFVDALLDIKDGTPALAIVPVADREGHAKHVAAAEAAAPKFDINIGAENDTQQGQYFKDDSGVWWLLDGDEWHAIEVLSTLEALEAQIAKPKKARKPRGKAAK